MADPAAGLPSTPGREASWHARDPQAVLDAFKTTPEGLSSEEVALRQTKFGPNRLPSAKRQGPLKRLLRQFHNLLIYVLLASASLSLFLGHAVDAVVILGVVLVNAGIGFIQEGRAEQALNAIRGMIAPKASVLRGGRRMTVAADEIVPGDIVLIEAGDRVPADMRLIHARNLKIDEAVLTGESVPADKAVESSPVEAALGDRSSMAYSGTFVAAGQGSGVVTGIGMNTELGRISSLLGTVESLKTPLIRQMDGFARQLTTIILIASALTFLFAYLVRQYAVNDAFMVVIGLAVSAIPEGLPAILTIALAIGVQRMAARNAIIRRLPAVETLGAVSVICSDKTGTLTRNEMAARVVRMAGATYDVSGVGYAPDGAFEHHGKAVDPTGDAVLMEVIRTGLLCSDAEVRRHEDQWVVYGDPMEGALITLAMKAGLNPAEVRKDLPRTDAIPFDSAHRYMATLHHDHEQHGYILIKGAPERLLEMCAYERHDDGDRPLDAAAWHEAADLLAAKGLRVLAFAVKPASAGQANLEFGDVDTDAVLLGFIGFMDPPREETIAAVRECRAAGIRVVMITGDHAVTAQEIARQIGLAENPQVLTGKELDALDDDGWRWAAQEVDVFARAAPEHKLRLVEALQAEGLTVAMTGDGVNDAPALKRADVGVAMGRKGTEAAKEASEMVLADDNFATIVAAVREGRTVYDNIRKVIVWNLPTDGGEGLAILLAIFLGLALPITPLQILWINTVTAVTLGLTLAFEPTEPGAMRRPPRPSHEPILSGEIIWRIVFVSALVVAGAFGMFYWSLARGQSLEMARTLVVNAIVAMEIFYLFSVRYVHGVSLTWQGILGTPAVLLGVGAVTIAQLVFTYAPVMNAVFDSRPVSLLDGLAVVGVGVALFVIAELEKWVRTAIAASISRSVRTVPARPPGGDRENRGKVRL